MENSTTHVPASWEGVSKCNFSVWTSYKPLWPHYKYITKRIHTFLLPSILFFLFFLLCSETSFASSSSLFFYFYFLCSETSFTFIYYIFNGVTNTIEKWHISCFHTMKFPFTYILVPKFFLKCIVVPHLVFSTNKVFNWKFSGHLISQQI